MRTVGVWILFALLLASIYAVPFGKRFAAKKVKDLPQPDGNLNIYSLPIGQGDSHVVQCPDGALTLFDMGSNDYNWDEPDPNSRFMTTDDIKTFFGAQQSRIGNIFLSHNHYDHYVLLVRTFMAPEDLSGLENIYISCTVPDMAWRIDEWVTAKDLTDAVRTINNGDACGPNNVECSSIDLCPNDPDVSTWIMAANLGQHCSDDGNVNMDSIVVKVERAGTTIMFSGDFEDETTDWDEDGIQKMMVDFYGETMHSTIFPLSHHGASFLANKPVFQNAIAPKAIIASANTAYSYHHPRCSVIDGLLDFTQSICKPNAAEGDSSYCGIHPIDNVPPEDRVQPRYSCGLSSDDTECPDQMCQRDANDFAIFTTVPDDQTINLVQLMIDAGGNWGFQMNLETSV